MKKKYFLAFAYILTCTAIVTCKIICWVFDVLLYAYDTFTF